MQVAAKKTSIECLHYPKAFVSSNVYLGTVKINHLHHFPRKNFGLKWEQIHSIVDLVKTIITQIQKQNIRSRYELIINKHLKKKKKD